MIIVGKLSRALPHRARVNIISTEKWGARAPPDISAVTRPYSDAPGTRSNLSETSGHSCITL